MGIAVHGVYAVVVAGDEVLGAGSLGEPLQGATLTAAPAAGDIAENPDAVEGADSGIPPKGEFVVVSFGGVEATYSGDEGMPEV